MMIFRSDKPFTVVSTIMFKGFDKDLSGYASRTGAPELKHNFEIVSYYYCFDTADEANKFLFAIQDAGYTNKDFKVEIGDANSIK